MHGKVLEGAALFHPPNGCQEQEGLRIERERGMGTADKEISNQACH